jgi:dynein heavy chain, axonemal
MLENMMQQWEKINFQMLPYKGITHIIKGYDDIQAVLDEHIINTQTMQFSQFKKPFEEQILKWYGQLKLASDIMEEWAKFQGQWMYLQPVFDSADIAKQLPGESKKFKSVDQVWKLVITHAKNTGNVMKTCGMESLLEKLQECNKSLEAVQKELNNYLEKKRDRFARFFFLSDDELLEILSQTKEPTAVQPHLKKVFENINTIEFDERKKILAMYSAEKEKVNFVRPVDPVGKNVEDWMGDLEEMMKESVKSALLKSVTDYLAVPRDQWVKRHPGQCVLNGSQVHWTSEVEQAIRKGKQGVAEYYKKLETQLLDLVVLVRQKLTKQQQVN